MEKELFLNKIKDLIVEINKECFNNLLILEFPIQISNTSKCSAHVSFIGKKPDMFSKMIYSVKSLSVSKNFVWTDLELKDTLIHELIHIYEVQVLKEKPSHGLSFKIKMNKINNEFGYNVSIRHSMKTTKKNKEKTIYYLLSEDRSKIVFLSNKLVVKINEDKNIFKKNFGEFSIGQVSSEKIKGYRVSRKFKYSYKIDLLKLKEIGIVNEND